MKKCILVAQHRGIDQHKSNGLWWLWAPIKPFVFSGLLPFHITPWLISIEPAAGCSHYTTLNSTPESRVHEKHINSAREKKLYTAQTITKWSFVQVYHEGLFLHPPPKKREPPSNCNQSQFKSKRDTITATVAPPSVCSRYLRRDEQKSDLYQNKSEIIWKHQMWDSNQLTQHDDDVFWWIFIVSVVI